jgi:hypothetical protein
VLTNGTLPKKFQTSHQTQLKSFYFQFRLIEASNFYSRFNFIRIQSLKKLSINFPSLNPPIFLLLTNFPI